jgi:hypothetical protein
MTRAKLNIYTSTIFDYISELLFRMFGVPWSYHKGIGTLEVTVSFTDVKRSDITKMDLESCGVGLLTHAYYSVIKISSDG